MEPKTLDHVALWVEDRDSIANLLTGSVGMHVIDRTDTFTLVGSDARRGKLTFFDAEGPRERGALKHVALRVNDLPEALGKVPGNGDAFFDVVEGVRIGLVEPLPHEPLEPLVAARALGAELVPRSVAPDHAAREEHRPTGPLALLEDDGRRAQLARPSGRDQPGHACPRDPQYFHVTILAGVASGAMREARSR